VTATVVPEGVIAMMWWNDGQQWYWGLAMMAVFWGAIVAIVYLAFRGRSHDDRRPSARELLDERFARGELSQEEYERARASLEGRTPATHP
jgi:putative membrane protein